MTEKPCAFETRGEQLFRRLPAAELSRIHRFGTACHYPAGATTTVAEQLTDGSRFILSGAVAVTGRGTSGKAQPQSIAFAVLPLKWLPQAPTGLIFAERSRV